MPLISRPCPKCAGGQAVLGSRGGAALPCRDKYCPSWGLIYPVCEQPPQEELLPLSSWLVGLAVSGSHPARSSPHDMGQSYTTSSNFCQCSFTHLAAASLSCQVLVSSPCLGCKVLRLYPCKQRPRKPYCTSKCMLCCLFLQGSDTSRATWQQRLHVRSSRKECTHGKGSCKLWHNHANSALKNSLAYCGTSKHKA